MVVLNVLSKYALFVDVVEVDVPVSGFLSATAEALLNAINSWSGLLSRGPVKTPIRFHETSTLTATERRVFDVADADSVIVGWSEGKESKACIEIAREMGHVVHRVAIGAGYPGERVTHVALYDEGNLSDVAQLTARFPELRGRHFIWQPGSSPGLYAALLIACRALGASRVLVGAEFGTGVCLDDRYDFACDEGYPVIAWFNHYIAGEYGGNVRVYSPVATLTEVGILRFILNKGIRFRELESCWYFRKVGGRNCEGCTKCNRLKTYGSYLVNKGHLQIEELQACYRSLDFPRVSTPMTSTFSWITESIERDIATCNPARDWSIYYLDHPNEVEVTGPYMAVIERHFERLDWKTCLPTPGLRFNAFDNEYCRNEFFRVFGFDYWQHVPPALAARPIMSERPRTGWTLPYEHFFYEGAPHGFVDWFDVWPTYHHDGSFAIHLHILGDAGQESDDRCREPRIMPNLPEGSALRQWLLREEIERFLWARGVRFKPLR
jgi:hypothetical protein